MSNEKRHIKKFPLLPFSQLVYDMTRLTPWVCRFPITFVWRNGKSEKERIEDAIRTALANHPIFQMQVDWHRQQCASLPKDLLHGSYHDVTLLANGEDLIIRLTISRILGDGKSGEILLEDIQRVYEGKPLESDNYWGYLEYVEQQKQSKHYTDSKEWLKREFADESIPVHPTPDKHLWTLLPPKAGLYKADYTDLHERIIRLSEAQYLSLDGFFSLCAALAIAEYCGTDSAALTWAYEGRERPEEQRIFGSLHRDIPFQINHKSSIINHKSDLIKVARNQIRNGIAHSDYPYTLTKPYSNRWNYAVNVLRIVDEYELIKLLPPFVELLPSSSQKYAYALLDVEIHESADNLALWYRYSATHYKESSIRRFADLIQKYALWLLGG